MPSGYLVIADISGYTSFLSHAELEPAAEHLRRLLDILIDNTRPPLHVSRLEGDAVISYALDGTFLRGQTLVEMIEGTYVAFRRALDQLVLNTRCDCNACQYVPDLDLKFFVHYGTFLLQPLGKRHEELIGTDVNLIHRLTKNHVTEKTGRLAYVAYTEQAVHHLEMEELAGQMPSIIETYDHIGEILVFVQDMHEVWEQKQPDMQLEVSETEALARFEALFPAGQVLMWDYITLPDYRFLFSGSGSMKVDHNEDGRIGAGTTYQCIEGGQVSLHTIRSWDPPRQYTYESDRPLGSRGWTTLRLEPAGDQTRLTVLVGKNMGSSQALQLVLNPAYRQLSGRKVVAGLTKLREKVVTELVPGESNMVLTGD